MVYDPQDCDHAFDCDVQGFRTREECNIHELFVNKDDLVNIVYIARDSFMLQ